MINWFFALFSIVLILILGFLIFFIVKKIKKTSKDNFNNLIHEILDVDGFFAKKIVPINQNLSLALNREDTLLAIVEKIKTEDRESYKITRVHVSFVKNFEKLNNTFKLEYIKDGEKNNLIISPINKEIEEFLYKIIKINKLKLIKEKYKENQFDVACGSDCLCSYLWAYDSMRCVFAYLKNDRMAIEKINLKKAHFTIDCKYNYLEMPLFYIPQQLFFYESNFLWELFSAVIKKVKERTVEIYQDMIFYDNFSNILYLSNGVSSLQSVILDRVEEIDYFDNKISFRLLNDEKTINFISNPDLTIELKKFITNLNLSKIAYNFDYSVDKLLNTTKTTKFIIDFSRERLIYCANLFAIKSFNYIVVSFENLASVQLIKNGFSPFVRIKTKDNKTLDITCEKPNIASYIMGQIDVIIKQSY